MQAVLFPGGSKVDLVERPTPEPRPGEVLVRTRASAICRSDMGLYKGTATVVGGSGSGSGRIVPGHEPAGEVVAIGEGVTGVKVGDRVAGYLPVGCGHCEHCDSGFLMLCDQWQCLGFDLDGGDADYFVLPERNCLPLPDEVTFVAGALMTDMVGSQYHTQKVMGVRGGKTLAVFGLGPMGGAAVLVGKALGARVVAIDLLPERLEVARKLGADEVIDSRSEDAVSMLRTLTDGRGVEVAVDCSGSPAAQNAALDAAAKRGHVAFVGESASTTVNPSDQWIRKLLTVTGGWYFPLGEWREICDLVVASGMPIESLVTHRFTLSEAERAFAMFDARETEKAVFVWN